MCASLLALVVSLGAEGDESGAAEWPSYGADGASSKYLPLEQIDRDNFTDLNVAWIWHSPDASIIESYPDEPRMRRVGFKATPLMVDGTLYLSTGLGQVAAVDAVSGETLWLHNPESYIGGGQANILGPITRGVSYWAQGEDRRVLTGTHDGYLIALDVKTGKPIPSFGEDGKVDLMTAVPRVSRGDKLVVPGGEAFHLSVDSPPMICRDVVVVGSSMSDRASTKEWPPGYVQAFDVRTGALKWVFRTITAPILGRTTRGATAAMRTSGA